MRYGTRQRWQRSGPSDSAAAFSGAPGHGRSREMTCARREAWQTPRPSSTPPCPVLTLLDGSGTMLSPIKTQAKKTYH